MNESQKSEQPGSHDVVLGGQSSFPSPDDGYILGGLEGTKNLCEIYY